jgi:hypothetical protein
MSEALIVKLLKYSVPLLAFTLEHYKAIKASLSHFFKKTR